MDVPAYVQKMSVGVDEHAQRADDVAVEADGNSGLAVGGEVTRESPCSRREVVDETPVVAAVGGVVEAVATDRPTH